MVGGWEPAAQLPIEEALHLAQDRLKERSQEALRHALSCWHSSLPLYAAGGRPPDPPSLPDED